MCGTVLRQSLVKRTKKAHQCDLCGRIIPKGTMAGYCVTADGGDMLAGYDCLDCGEFIKTREAREFVEDDGCVYGFAFAEQPYARFPILEPVLKVGSSR